MNKQVIYFDNNSTTQIDSRVLDSMMPFLTTEYGNANSTHYFGIIASEAIKKARFQVADLINADPNEIIFTSGSTEAINLALKGVTHKYSSKGKHIITVLTEHSAVLDTCQYLKSMGCEISYLSVNEDGLIDLEELKNNIRIDTILVCVMLANNETGVMQPIKEISNITHGFDALFMTDATQAVGKIPINVNELGIDIMCLSGHKMYGPKGVGALFLRQRTNKIKLSPLIHGGGHEKGIRSGTLNVPSIVALGVACLIAKKEMAIQSERILLLRNYLEIEILKIKNTHVIGNIDNRLFNTTNIMFHGIDSEALIIGLNNPENNLPIIAVSNGSACTSQSIKPSHVLIAMGLSEIDAFSCIRFSLGKNNTKEEVDLAIEKLNNIVQEIRLMIT